MNYKQFHEDIGFEPYQEIRVFHQGGMVRSYFARDYNEVQQIIEKNKNNNCYVGVNPRITMGGSGKDVTHRRMMVFDIEALGEKPPLSDLRYQMKLNHTVDILTQYIKESFQLDVTYIIKSGRGLHVYYMIEPLHIDFQMYYNKFYTHIINYVNSHNIYFDIKCDPPVKDLPRIFGLPGTQNTKYKEKSAFRKIVKYNKHDEQDIEPFLLKLKEKLNSKPKKVTKKDTRTITMDNILKTPEFKILKFKNLPKGSVNNKLRLALKLLMKENNFTYPDTEIVAKEITKYAKPYKNMFMGDAYQDYKYSKQILNRWCIENFEWCVQNKFKLPYQMNYKTDPNSMNSSTIVDYSCDDIIECWDDLISFIVKFNKKTSPPSTNQGTIYYTIALKKYVKQNCDPIFYQFVDDNNILKKIHHLKVFKNIEKDDVSDLILT